jgi:hypothetical protein
MLIDVSATSEFLLTTVVDKNVDDEALDSTGVLDSVVISVNIKKAHKNFCPPLHLVAYHNLPWRNVSKSMSSVWMCRSYPMPDKTGNTSGFVLVKTTLWSCFCKLLIMLSNP